MVVGSLNQIAESKLRTNVENCRDCLRLKDLVIKWEMKFRADKCKMTYMGKNNPNFTYKIMGSDLTAITQK